MLRILKSSSKNIKQNITLNSIKQSYLYSLTELNYSHPNDNNNSHLIIKRHYSLTSKNQNSLIIGGLSVLAVSVGLQAGVKLYEQYKANKSANPSPTNESTETNETTTADATTEKVSSSKTEEQTKQKTEKKSETTTTTEESGGFFSNFFSTTFYDGGFEEKMTKREAALILGVRESATVDRIKDAHRRILINNHPDRGGSPFIAAKVNEAKDFLLKGKN